MMKKILFALAFLVCLVSSAQIKPNHDGVNLTPLTTVEINALTGMLEGDIQYNSTTETLWRYNGTAWADTDSGLSSTDIDTFAEIDAIVADKSLVNLEDAQTFAGINTFDNNLLLGSSASDANLFKLRHISTSNLNHQTLNYGVLYFQNDGQFTMGSGLGTNNISFDWTANTVDREYIWPDASGTIALTSDIGASGDLWSDPVDADIVPSVDNSYSLGSSTNFFDVGHFNRVVLDPITTGDFWTTDIVTGNHYGFGYLATPTTTFSELYTLNNTGTPSAATDLIDKAYADANYAGGGSLPVDDTTALVQDPVDNTKQARLDVGALTTGNTRVLTMPDADVDLGALTSANLATGSVTTTEIALGTIQGNDIDVNTITSGNILDDAILPSKLAISQTLGAGLDGYVVVYDNTNNEFDLVASSTIGAADQTLSLSGTGNKDLTISGTGGNTIDLTGVDGIDADNIVSKGTARTSPTQYTDIYGQTQANYNTDGAPGAGELVIITDASPAEVVTSATVTMDGWKMYDDQTADAATITLSDCDPGETLTVYINRASAPTLAGTGLTFNQLPNTTAFAAATTMMIVFEVAYDGTTIDYYYVER